MFWLGDKRGCGRGALPQNGRSLPPVDTEKALNYFQNPFSGRIFRHFQLGSSRLKHLMGLVCKQEFAGIRATGASHLCRASL
jgi:hypothetical protein